MLFTQTVRTETLELLKRLMADGNLPAFRLVGGTALALMMGHRVSVDLDLFTDTSFNEQELREYLEQHYGLQTEFLAKETVKGVIDEVQIDCIAHTYSWLEAEVTENGIRLASIEDICAMKLNAIAGNGTRIKDFIDIAYLSSRFSFNQMLKFYEEKYKSSIMMPIKAITYFDEINLNEPVRMLDGNKPNWKLISKRLQKMQANPDKVFEKL